MSIKVTFEFETNEDAIAFLQDQAPADPSQDFSAPAQPTKGRGRPRKEAAAAAAPAAAATPPAAAPAPAAAAPETAAQPAAKEVVDALCALADVDTPKAKAILASFGATSFGKQPANPASVALDPKHYAAALAQFKAALATPTPAAGAGLI
jgi:hypothetical protein